MPLIMSNSFATLKREKKQERERERERERKRERGIERKKIVRKMKSERNGE